LSNVLIKNKTIISLNLGNNPLKNEGTQILCSSMFENFCIK